MFFRTSLPEQKIIKKHVFFDSEVEMPVVFIGNFAIQIFCPTLPVGKHHGQCGPMIFLGRAVSRPACPKSKTLPAHTAWRSVEKKNAQVSCIPSNYAPTLPICTGPNNLSLFDVGSVVWWGDFFGQFHFDLGPVMPQMVFSLKLRVFSWESEQSGFSDHPARGKTRNQKIRPLAQ